MKSPVSTPPAGNIDSTRVTWYAMSVDAVLARQGSAPLGLSVAEAARRLAIHGANELQASQRASPWLLLLEQFKNVLVIILLVATVLSAFMGHGVEAIAIAVIVLFAVLLGFIQEFRAGRAIEALRRMAAPVATVLRDGTERSVPARDLVPGDMIILRAGDKVPADARLCESINLQIEEAVLTGESLAVEKHTAALAAMELPVGDRRNMAYAGTAVTYGRGRALVVATGMHTEFGSIARMLQGVDSRKTPLQENLDKVGHLLARVAFAIVAALVAIGLLRGQPFVEMLVFGIALAVAVVPEALPAVVTISLAIGVQRMVKRHALMRRLPAVETLGCTSVICSDKTGTLTKDEMTVRRVVAGDQTLDVSGAGYAPQGQFTCGDVPVQPGNPVLHLLQAAILASDARVEYDPTEGRWRVKGDPTEGAMVVAAAKAGMDKAELDARYPRIDEIPFTSETKRMTTLHGFPDGVVAFAKGAPEVIVGACTQQSTASGEMPLDAASRDAILATARQMAGNALRVLAIATKTGATRATAEQGMTLLGLVGMIDPPRPEAKAAIQTCRQAGIRVVMITGDHPVTAQAVASELGLLRQGRVVTGPELDAMPEADFQRAVTEVEVYARVSPAHKLRVVTALQGHGAVVAMTGDGVNDAPALKQADIGIAMGITGTDVTKEAAAMTLTDDNFASIVAAVEEGRAIFDNIKKYLMYLLSSNIGEMGLMVAATLAGMPLPLTAVQILYVNLATDGLPALALAVDPADRGIMQRAPRNPHTGIFSRPVVTLMLVGGLWSAMANMALFQWARMSGRSLAEAMSMTFVALVLIQFFKAYNYRSDRQSAMSRPFANRWLNLAIAWELLLLLAVIYVPFLQRAVGTFSLSPTDWLIVSITSLTIFPVLELAKWLVRRGWFGGREATPCPC